MKFFPRRAALVAVAASIALVVPACSSNDEPAATTTSTESGAFPRTIEHFRGSTEIPAAPQRIVALDNSFNRRRPSPRIPARRLRRLPRARSARLPRILAGGIRRGRRLGRHGQQCKPREDRRTAAGPHHLRRGPRREELRAALRNRAPPSSPRRPVRRGRTTSAWSVKRWARSHWPRRRSPSTKPAQPPSARKSTRKANNPVISVVRFAGEPTARLYRTTSFSGIVLQDAGLKRPDNQGPDPADAGNIMMKISPELINEADADVIFISTWQDAEGQERRSCEAVPREPAVGRPFEDARSTWTIHVGCRRSASRAPT